MDLESYVVAKRLPEREILFSCLRLLGVCDVILASPHARSSTGALIEMMLQGAANKRIIYATVEDVQKLTGEIFITKIDEGKVNPKAGMGIEVDKWDRRKG